MKKNSAFSRWLSPLQSSQLGTTHAKTQDNLNYESKSLTSNSWVALDLPSLSHFGKFILWGIGRLCFSSTLFICDIASATLTGMQISTKWLRGSVVNLLKIYEQLPYMGTRMDNIIDVTVLESTLESLEIITDLVSAVQSKQLMIIGEMGTGKSTIAQYLAIALGKSIRVYECEGTPTDWQGLEVIGKGENWESIELGMKQDLEDLSNQMKIREQHGDNALEGTEKAIICEEYPELVRKVPSSCEWLERHARRGRKARRFTILLSQYDRVAAWGLENKADLAEAFLKLRLGKKAIKHAKSLKNEEVVAWLSKDRSHALLDDTPCKLPSYREMRITATQPLLNHQNNPKNFANNELKPLLDKDFKPVTTEDSKILWRLIQRLGKGKSDTFIVTEILGYTGKQYSEGKDILDVLREQFQE